MKVLMSGGTGNLAKELIAHNTDLHQIVAPSKSQMDVTDLDTIKLWFIHTEPDIFIHTAALTRPMIKHKENPEVSVQTNIIGTANVVLACMELGVKLIYISTDYVYEGVHGNYKEDDPIYPVNEYAWSKLGGECAVRLYDNSLILRTSMCQRPFPHKLALVDAYKNLIYIDQAAQIIWKLISEVGIINVGGDAQSVYDFAKKEIPNIEKASICGVTDVHMACDASMNLTKMKKALND